MSLLNTKASVPDAGDVVSAVSWKNDHVGTIHFKSGKDVQFCVKQAEMVVKEDTTAKEYFASEPCCQFREKADEVITKPEQKPEGIPMFGF